MAKYKNIHHKNFKMNDKYQRDISNANQIINYNDDLIFKKKQQIQKSINTKNRLGMQESNNILSFRSLSNQK
jgi:hypothetical protein